MKLSIMFITILSIFILCSLADAQSKKSYKIIVNKSNTISSITIDQLSKIFLKKTTLWKDDTKILPVDLKSDAKARIAFSEDIHNKSVNAIKAFWQKQIFSGKGVPPPEKSSVKDVVTYVKENPGAIGYVGYSIDISGTKTIKITD